MTSERGLTTHNVFAAATDQSLVAAGKRVVVLADHAKVGAEAMCQTVPTESMDVLITDSKADAAELARIAAAPWTSRSSPSDRTPRRHAAPCR